MKLNFALYGILQGRQEHLLSIEAAMPTGRHRLAVFSLIGLLSGPTRAMSLAWSS